MMAEVRFELRVRDSVIEAVVQVPEQPIRPIDLLPILQQFDDGFIATAVGDAPVSCRAGCGACCRQAVPIGETEALNLARVIGEMPEARKAHVLERFARAVAALDLAGMRERLQPEALKDKGAQRKMALDYFALGVACPFLEEESCSIHADRPLSCREYLVTSPAVNCAAPSADTIKMIPLPGKFSEILFRFGDGRGDEATKWVPLPYLLEYAAGHPAEEQPSLPGPEMFRNFLKQLAE
jgi:Fe-S-cluster containining protein